MTHWKLPIVLYHWQPISGKNESLKVSCFPSQREPFRLSLPLEWKTFKSSTTQTPFSFQLADEQKCNEVKMMAFPYKFFWKQLLVSDEFNGKCYAFWTVRKYEDQSKMMHSICSAYYHDSWWIAGLQCVIHVLIRQQNSG